MKGDHLSTIDSRSPVGSPLGRKIVVSPDSMKFVPGHLTEPV